MWAWIAGRVLRNRIAILVVVGLLSIVMGWFASRVGMNYKRGGLLPSTDSAYVEYERFLAQFSEDGNVMVVGVQDDRLYTPEGFSAWYTLGNELRLIPGIDSVFSEAHLLTLLRDDSLQRFQLANVVSSPPRTQAELDTILAHVHSLPFYRGLLYNDSTHASLMMVFVNAKVYDTPERMTVHKAVRARMDRFEQETGFEAHMSGLPWIRVENTSLIEGEMPWFMAGSLMICALLLLIFFRSWRAMWICMTVVILSVIWSFGFMGIMGYKVSLIMSVIAPLVIVTGVPNCVFLINAYHYEYVHHRNRMKALQRVISRVGAAAFMTNAVSAVGFATFCLTYSDVLIEFGWVSTWGIMVLWVLSMLLIPILFSFMPEPTQRHLGHLERHWLDNAVEWIVRTSKERRPLIYTLTAIATVLACWGILRLKDESRIVDDLPENSPILTDLRFFERNFHGVMPLEVVIDTKKKGGALKEATLKRIERLEDSLSTHPQLSRPISIADAVKFTKQAFYNGDPAYYALIEPHERQFILPYVESAGGKRGMGRGFLDSTRQVTRLTVQMADIGTTRMDTLMGRLRAQVDSIFPVDKYHTTLTGTSVVFLKGSNYLVWNLITSLFWAIVLIVALMALLFNSLRILIVSLIPNVIPLIVTAGIMGFFGIPIKPSTMLVFGIALGIAIDNAIHFLARYRLELKLTGHDLKRSVDLATREVSVGVIYTSVVLLAGFSLFAFSHFGGIQALGVLTCITLLVAALTNLLVLPSLLLTLNKAILSKAFEEPLLEIMDEEEDIALHDLKLEDGPNG